MRRAAEKGTFSSPHSSLHGVEYRFHLENRADPGSPSRVPERIISGAKFHGEPRETVQEIT